MLKRIKRFKIDVQFCSIILILILLSQNFSHFQNRKVNAILIADQWCIGPIFPSRNISQVSLTKADILIEIDAEKFKDKLELSCSSNFTIQNLGSDLNLSLITPFVLKLYYKGDPTFDLENLLSIRLDESKIPFSIVHSWATLNWTSWSPNDFPINNTLGRYWEGYFVIANISVPSDSLNELSYDYSISIEREWHSSLDKSYKIKDEVGIGIIIGTLKAWLGEINARVRIIIKGKQPIYYSDYDEFFGFFKNCSVVELNESTLYEWKWEQEPVIEDYISVYYPYLKKSLDFRIIVMIPVTVLVITVVAILLHFFRKRKIK